MARRTRLGVLAIVAAALFFVTGLRHEQGSLSTFSYPVCGPLTDGNGKVVGDAGPCPSFDSRPTFAPNDDRWEWAPFWVASD